MLSSVLTAVLDNILEAWMSAERVSSLAGDYVRQLETVPGRKQ